MSKEALHRFITKGTQNPDIKDCQFKKGPPEDVQLGRCMALVGVQPADSRDSLGRHRFFPFPGGFYTEVRNLTEANLNYWIWKYNYYPQPVVSPLID